MTIFISIVGLGLLVFVHELGHFTASVALRMHPRKFYIGFPPAVVKRTRTGIEYGIGTIPLWRLREDSRHAPAGSADVDPVFGRAIEERRASPARPTGCAARSTRRPRRCARSLAAFATSPAESALGAGARRGRQGRHRHRRRARPRCVLARPHLEARARDLRRAGREHHLRVRPLHRPVHDLRRQATTRRQRPREDRSRSARPRSGDKIVDQRQADESGKHDLRHDRPVAGSRSRSSSSGTETESRSGRRRRRRSTGPIASVSSSKEPACRRRRPQRRRAASPASCRRASSRRSATS